MTQCTWTVALITSSNHISTCAWSIQYFCSICLPFRWRSRLRQFLLTSPAHVRLPEWTAYTVWRLVLAADRMARHHARIRCTATWKWATCRCTGRRLAGVQVRRGPPWESSLTVMAVRRWAQQQRTAIGSMGSQWTERCGFGVKASPTAGVRVTFLGETAGHIGATSTAAATNIAWLLCVLFVPVGNIESLQWRLHAQLMFAECSICIVAFL